MTDMIFGTLPDGTRVAEARLSAGRLSASVIGLGAALRGLRVTDQAGRRRDVVLGFRSLEDTLAHSPNAGVIAGRFANRIAQGRFTLDGTDYQLARNLGEHHLHGGPTGFGKRIWTLTGATATQAVFALHSPDGDEGYPGALDLTASYEIAGPATLRLTIDATTTAATPLNLAHHPYWILMGGGDVSGDRLTVAAAGRLETDAQLIPTGRVLPVEGSGYDFQSTRRIVSQDSPASGYDTTLVLSRGAPGLTHAATLQAADGGLAMQVWTTEPAVQVYDASRLSIQVPGLHEHPYGPRAGICIEPQHFPDSPNHPQFPDCILRPGAPYLQVTEYRFI